MTGETADRHPGEHARPGSPPGWYADPVRKSSLRRWDGEHWTADVDPPAAVAEFQPSAKRHEFNWPVLVVAILVPAWCAVMVIVGFVLFAFQGSDPQQPWERVLEAFAIFASYFVVPPIVFLLGLLGIRRRYSTASRMAAVVPLLIGGLVSLNMFQDWMSGN